MVALVITLGTYFFLPSQTNPRIRGPAKLLLPRRASQSCLSNGLSICLVSHTQKPKPSNGLWPDVFC